MRPWRKRQEAMRPGPCGRHGVRVPRAPLLRLGRLVELAAVLRRLALLEARRVRGRGVLGRLLEHAALAGRGGGRGMSGRSGGSRASGCRTGDEAETEGA